MAARSEAAISKQRNLAQREAAKIRAAAIEARSNENSGIVDGRLVSYVEPAAATNKKPLLSDTTKKGLSLAVVGVFLWFVVRK